MPVAPYVSGDEYTVMGRGANFSIKSFRRPTNTEIQDSILRRSRPRSSMWTKNDMRNELKRLSSSIDMTVLDLNEGRLQQLGEKMLTVAGQLTHAEDKHHTAAHAALTTMKTDDRLVEEEMQKLLLNENQNKFQRRMLRMDDFKTTYTSRPSRSISPSPRRSRDPQRPISSLDEFSSSRHGVRRSRERVRSIERRLSPMARRTISREIMRTLERSLSPTHRSRGRSISPARPYSRPIVCSEDLWYTQSGRGTRSSPLVGERAREFFPQTAAAIVFTDSDIPMPAAEKFRREKKLIGAVGELKLGALHLSSHEITKLSEEANYDPSIFRRKIWEFEQERLRLEEDVLKEEKRGSELDRTRGPRPKWYELKTPAFHREANRNNNLLRNSSRYQELYDYQSELYNESEDFHRRWETPRYEANLYDSDL